VGPDTALWTIANDDPEQLRRLRERDGLQMPFLLDPDAEVIKQYGVYNLESDRVLPHPTALIIDKQGVVRYVRVDENYRERPPVAELLEALAAVR
jgi:peroxiredoxin